MEIRGFINNFQTCFINAVLQCIIHNKNIMELIEIISKNNNNNDTDITKNATKSIINLRYHYFHNSNTTLEPLPIIFNNFNDFEKEPNFILCEGKFKKGRQEDASEFLTKLIGAIFEEDFMKHHSTSTLRDSFTLKLARLRKCTTCNELIKCGFESSNGGTVLLLISDNLVSNIADAIRFNFYKTEILECRCIECGNDKVRYIFKNTNKVCINN